MDPQERQRQLERERLLEQERKDLEVERNRGPRPLEGFAGGPTSWTEEQDEAAAAGEHADDARRSIEASERQARGEPPETEEPDALRE